MTCLPIASIILNLLWFYSAAYTFMLLKLLQTRLTGYIFRITLPFSPLNGGANSSKIC